MPADRHFEPFVYVPDVTCEAALVAWGGFFFRRNRDGGGGDLDIVDDEDLAAVSRDRSETIGVRSEPYGHAVVELLDANGNVAARAETRERNHVWVRGLSPDTPYRYRIVVNGREWASDPLREWIQGPDDRRGLALTQRRYDMRLRTHPAPSRSVPLTFAVLGDFGIGVRTASESGVRQRTVARALERAAELYHLRLVLTVGDNVYLGPESDAGVEGTGDEDDDWYFTFYEPYRHVISRIPIYPAVGNHDSDEEEQSDDRGQLADNFFLEERFRDEDGVGRSSVDPGLFYTFQFGRDVSFVCIDTTASGELPRERYFQHPKHLAFLERALSPDGAPGAEAARWRIPFCHHPPFCAGPHHGNNEEMVRQLVPRFERAGVKLVLSGHEHNYQHATHDGVHYFVTGAAGKLRPDQPTGFLEAHTRAWAAEGHFLLVHVDADKAIVQPVARVDDDGRLVPPRVLDPDGHPVEAHAIIPR